MTHTMDISIGNSIYETGLRIFVVLKLPAKYKHSKNHWLGIFLASFNTLLLLDSPDQLTESDIDFHKIYTLDKPVVISNNKLPKTTMNQSLHTICSH